MTVFVARVSRLLFCYVRVVNHCVFFFFFSNGHRFSAHYFHSHITDDISRVRFYFERLAAHVRLRGRARSEALQDPPPIFFQANDQGKGVKEELLIGIDYYLHRPRC